MMMIYICTRFLGNGAKSEVLELGQIKLIRSEDHSKMTKVKFMFEGSRLRLYEMGN